MAIALIDTNIVIDFFKGVPDARKELLYYTDIAISNITYMEFAIGLRRDVGGGVITIAEFADSMAKLAGLLVIQINQKSLTRQSISGPTAFSAQTRRSNFLMRSFSLLRNQSRYMVTRDVIGYTSPLMRIPYQLSEKGILDPKLAKPR
jgi:hypothetical protein